MCRYGRQASRGERRERGFRLGTTLAGRMRGSARSQGCRAPSAGSSSSSRKRAPNAACAEPSCTSSDVSMASRGRPSSRVGHSVPLSARLRRLRGSRSGLTGPLKKRRPFPLGEGAPSRTHAEGRRRGGHSVVRQASLANIGFGTSLVIECERVPPYLPPTSYTSCAGRGALVFCGTWRRSRLACGPF